MSIDENAAVDSILATLDKAEKEAAQSAPPADQQNPAPEEIPASGSENEGQTEPAAEPAIAPPPFLKAEYKERWAELPTDWQRYLASKEEEDTRSIQAKLNESAEARKTAEAEKQAAAQERQRYANQLETLTQQFVQLDPVLSQAAQLKPADWDKLWSENPAQAGMLKHQIESRIATFQNWQMQRQQFLQEQTRTLQSQAETALADKLPDWRDTTKREELAKGIRKMLQDSYGYKPEELANLYDHRSVLVAYDAMRYRQMIAARQTAETKKVPVVPKVMKPANAQGERGESQRVKALKQRAIRSGKESDAVDAVLAAIGGS